MSSVDIAADPWYRYSMTKVRVALGATVNYGNFESGRFDYEITDDVRNDESIDDAILRVEAQVERHLMDRLDEEGKVKIRDANNE